MRVQIVRVGNSKGIRLPKAILDQCGFRDEIELSVEAGTVVLRPARRAREGWTEALAKADMSEQETLSPPGLPNDWDDEEWTW
jgi:antitoxin MazE